jgi:hypothetical protein
LFNRCGWQCVLALGADGRQNLVGMLPQSMSQRTTLEDLVVFGNHLSGEFPEVLIGRWLAGTLWVSAEPVLLTNISEIDFESSSSSILCRSHRIVMRSDGAVTVFTERCRNASPQDRVTYWEVRAAYVWLGDFAKLGRCIETNGFFDFQDEYYRNVTEGTFVSTRVTRVRKAYEVVNYADGGPFGLWIVQQAIEGVGEGAEWQKTIHQAKRPRWTNPLPPQKQ